MNTQELLQKACYDEYKAKAYYQKVIDTYGSVAPFSNIVEAESNRFSAIERLCQKYNVIPPNNDWYDKTVVGANLYECCQAGLDIEAANIEMYDKLLVYVSQDDIRDAFYRAQAASYNNYLPSFKQCVESDNVQNNETKNSEHHDIYNMVQGLMKGEVDSTKITQLVSSLGSRDMMLGLAVGAGLAMALSSDTSKDIISNIFNKEDKKDT